MPGNFFPVEISDEIVGAGADLLHAKNDSAVLGERVEQVFDLQGELFITGLVNIPADKMRGLR